MNKSVSLALAVVLCFALGGCAAVNHTATQSPADAISAEERTEDQAVEYRTEETWVQDGEKESIVLEGEDESETMKTTLRMKIGEVPVEVEWEDNESVRALEELASKGLTVQMSMYGGFEQVGPLGQSLPRNDVQTTTASGDIVLYSGNQIVVFYGSNAWAYTRLGHITDKTPQEMASLLGNGDVQITITLDR